LPFAAEVRFMRDPTRGGPAATLNEIVSENRAVGIRLSEESIPIRDSVRAAFEILGLDPLFAANEGKLLAVIAPESADRALAALREHPLGAEAAIIGEVVDVFPGTVFMETAGAGRRLVAMPEGELLPRIC